MLFSDCCCSDVLLVMLGFRLCCFLLFSFRRAMSLSISELLLSISELLLNGISELLLNGSPMCAHASCICLCVTVCVCFCVRVRVCVCFCLFLYSCLCLCILFVFVFVCDRSMICQKYDPPLHPLISNRSKYLHITYTGVNTYILLCVCVCVCVCIYIYIYIYHIYKMKKTNAKTHSHTKTHKDIHIQQTQRHTKTYISSKHKEKEDASSHYFLRTQAYWFPSCGVGAFCTSFVNRFARGIFPQRYAI